MLEKVHSPVFRLAASFWLLVALGFAPGADGADRSASMTVSARNAAYIRASVHDQPLHIAITAEDIERGFVEVPDAGTLALQTNNPAGTMLLVRLSDGPISSAEVEVTGYRRTIGPGGGWIDIPFNGTSKQKLEVSSRLFLKQDAQPGIVPWPLSFDGRMSGAGTPRAAISCASCAKPPENAARTASRR